MAKRGDPVRNSTESFLSGVAAILFIFGCWDWLHGSDWAARQYAEYEYNVPADKIRFSGKLPHDCELLSAPLGSKHCSYRREYLVEWVGLSSNTPPRPIEYGQLQGEPPTECSQDPTDFAHRCYYIDNEPGAKAISSGWHARSVEIEWQKVEE